MVISHISLFRTVVVVEDQTKELVGLMLTKGYVANIKDNVTCKCYDEINFWTRMAVLHYIMQHHRAIIH
jgi:hypothetical protein